MLRCSRGRHLPSPFLHSHPSSLSPTRLLQRTLPPSPTHPAPPTTTRWCSNFERQTLKSTPDFLYTRKDSTKAPTKRKKKEKKEEEEAEVKEDTPEGYMETAKQVLQSKFQKASFLTGKVGIEEIGREG
jgi:hypothetical protein